MKYLIFIGILVVVFGGTAMVVHLSKSVALNALEILLWTAALALFITLLILIYKGIMDRLTFIIEFLKTLR